MESWPIQCLMMAIRDGDVKAGELDDVLLKTSKANYEDHLWLSARVRLLGQFCNQRPELFYRVFCNLTQRTYLDIRALQMAASRLELAQLEQALRELTRENEMAASVVFDCMVQPLKTQEGIRMFSQSLLMGPCSMYGAWDLIDASEVKSVPGQLEKLVDPHQFKDANLQSSDSYAIAFLYCHRVLPKAWESLPNIRQILDHCRSELHRLL